MDSRAEAIAAELQRKVAEDLARERRIRAQRRKDFWQAVGLCAGAVGVLAVIVYLAWVLPSQMEARAFNRATGKNVSTWEAMWVDLRVQGEAE